MTYMYQVTYYPFSVALTFNDLMRGHSKGKVCDLLHMSSGGSFKSWGHSGMEYGTGFDLRENFILTKWNTMWSGKEEWLTMGLIVCFTAFWQMTHDFASTTQFSRSSWAFLMIFLQSQNWTFWTFFGLCNHLAFFGLQKSPNFQSYELLKVWTDINSTQNIASQWIIVTLLKG